MKRIKIFLASSIEDLREDRLQLGDFFRQINEIYLDRGIHFSLIKCEDYDNSMAAGGKQQEYDREIRESELVFFLFFRKVGDYTRHELEVALEAFRDRKKPRIVTYFKYITSIDEAAREVRDFMRLLDREMKHYYNTYGHIDTLKLGVLMQIKLLGLDSVQVRLEDGAVTLDGQTVARAENVPMLRGNQSLRELTEKRRQLQAALRQRRVEYLEDPTPENETAFFNTSAELNRVSKELTQVEQETMALLTTVAEMTADGRVLTHRQKEALKYFNAGDYGAVQAILRDEERENELRRARNRAEAAKHEIQGYVEEELLLIKTEMAQGLTAERVKRILAGYRKVMELVEQHGLQKSPLYDYASFLKDQNRFAEAIAVAEKLRWYYADPSAAVEEPEKAKLHNLLGILYSETQRYGDAEEAYRKALEAYSLLAARNPETFEGEVAKCWNNLGILRQKTQRRQEAEQAYGKALELHTRLAARNPEVYEPVLATTYNNLGLLYRDTHRYDLAEAAYGKALKIRRELVARHPEAWEPHLATTCNNLGLLLGDVRRYGEAETIHKQALEIYERLAARNPEAYEPVLATSCNNLGLIYWLTRRYEEAEKIYGRTLEIYRRLAAYNPDAFEPNLAAACSNLGSLYRNLRRYGEAEAAERKAVEIFTRLAARNPEAFAPELAKSRCNLGNIYHMTRRFGEAEALYGKALEQFIRLADGKPEAYGPELARCYKNMSRLYGITGRLEKMEEAQKKALGLFQGLAVRNPRLYEPDLAKGHFDLGLQYGAARRCPEAESEFEKALALYRRLGARDPKTWEPELADTLWNLISLYVAQKQGEKLLGALLEAQPLVERLAKQYPDRYQQKAAVIRQVLREE
ncbi:MAG: tetratricopeptide repeat protein [Oscillospiraceae bacterium]|nr:tetratricopeptide repeat protein [Oscillospiraceae bacterium]